MARKFLTPIDLAQNELQNARVQNLGSAPATPVKGQLYMNTSDNTLYWYDGTGWIAAKAAAGATPATSVTTSAVGDAGVVGVSTNFARQDHLHGREAFGAVTTSPTTFGAAKVDGTAVTVAHSDHHHGTPTHDNAAHSTIPINALAGATGLIDMNGFTITEVGTPVNPTDATNKSYVDNTAAGLDPKPSVRIASTGNQALTGLTAIDGITPIANDRILLKNQTAPAENGIWVAAAGAWARATDADAWTELISAYVFVEQGTTMADTGWNCTVDQGGTLGTTAVTWVQFSGGGMVTAGAGMTQSGNVLNINGDPSIVVTADAITRGALTGDVTAAQGDTVTVIANDAVTNAKLANMPANTIKGNNTAGAADPVDLTRSTFTAMFAGFLPRIYVATFGGSTQTDIAHAFNTRDVIVSVYRVASPYDEVECDVEHLDVNNVRLRFAVAPAASEYRCVVMG